MENDYAKVAGWMISMNPLAGQKHVSIKTGNLRMPNYSKKYLVTVWIFHPRYTSEKC